MSIRTRVLSVTLGLAVAGFVVTLDAIDDKVLIVRDGSVDVFLYNSRLDEKDGDKHKWHSKAEVVQVFEGPTAAEACTTKLTEPVKFSRVVLKIRDLTKEESFDVNAFNEDFFKKLKLELPPKSQWQFAFRQYKHRLVYGDETPERVLKILQVDVTPPAPGATATYTAKQSPGFLCVLFRNR